MFYVFLIVFFYVVAKFIQLEAFYKFVVVKCRGINDTFFSFLYVCYFLYGLLTIVVVVFIIGWSVGWLTRVFICYFFQQVKVLHKHISEIKINTKKMYKFE